MRLWFSSLVERSRASLFVVPVFAVGFAVVVAAVVGLGIDRNLTDDPDLAFGLTSTVESSRTVLATVASATVTITTIAFSISLLVIQQTSSQYSPRVVHSLFRDPFNKRVMGLVVGTFAFCLIVLRSVRAAADDAGEPVIPHVSVLVAVVLGLASVLAIVAFINHSAHAMDVSEILGKVATESVRQITKDWSPADPGSNPVPPEMAGVDDHHVVSFLSTGWVQQIDVEGLGRAAPAGSVIRLRTHAGRYAVNGAPICSVSPTPSSDDLEDIESRVRASIGIGDSRTMQQDVSFGLRQLVDVALKALSPGINDPTTAQDALFHTANVLGELLRRQPPPMLRGFEGERWVVMGEEHSHEDLVSLAYDEVRRAAVTQPAVCVYLLESLRLLRESVASSASDDVIAQLRDQADLVLAGCEHAGLLPADLDVVQTAHRKRFPTPDTTA